MVGDLVRFCTSRWRPVSSAARQTARCRAACCLEGLAYKPIDRATSRERAARQRGLRRAALETGRLGESPTFGALSCCR
jgi:hypothetical protein